MRDVKDKHPERSEMADFRNKTKPERKTMIPTILLVIVVLVAVLAAVIASRPGEFRVTRSAAMSASPAEVFAQVNDFHNWESWSPWAKLDPNARNSFEGPSSGNGAVFRWSGDKNIGVGNMTITESRASDLIRIRLDFEKPFKCSNAVEFTFLPEGSQTRVTWSMSGRNNFMAKAVGLFMNCDKMVGGMFEKGLAQMKSVVEDSRS